MLSLTNVIDELFSCLGPLRACQEPIQDRCVDPLQEHIIEPIRDRCVDPVLHSLEVNPLGCVPGLGLKPSLPQYNTETQQKNRAAQLARTEPDYQYNYGLVRTFRVEERDGKRVGVQGKGLAILDSLPFEQLPSLCFIILALQQALLVVDNLLVVLDLISQPERRQKRSLQRAKVSSRGKTGAVSTPRDAEEDIVSATLDDVDPEELDRRQEEVKQLRENLVGTLGWGRKIARHVGGTHDTSVSAQPLRALAPVSEAKNNEPRLLCPCPRCSPQNFTRELFEDIKQDLSNIAERMLMIPALDRQPKSIKAYNDLFQRIPLPQFAHTFESDEMFALQRVAGQNPVVLQRTGWTKAWAKKFPVTAAQYTQVMGEDDSLESAGKEGRLYLCDYEDSLGNTIGGDFPPFAGQKYINAPLALFALLKSDRNVLRAVAIQAGQEPGPDNPIFTPDGGWNWEIAKTIVQNADCNDSEYFRHLGLGHLLTEAFILATYRQLPRQHPLYVLLTPHFQGTLATNSTAVNSINQEGSYLNVTESIFSGTIPATLGIAANAVSGVNYFENRLPNDLRRRGVDDPALLPNYPYRDDALLIWNAIAAWVTDYVDQYYTSDTDVEGDYELQNWVAEVSSAQGGRIKNVGEDGQGNRIVTLDYLIECLTQVIYTASAHHALTNFPLEDYELYAPGWPGALYQEAPKTAKGATRQDWLAYLAPLNIALLQQALGTVVGGVYFTELGYYPVCHFADNRVRIPLLAFQSELRRIEDIINERNMTRPLKYPYLLPSRIPQSTNI
jgi:arachidonate 15-lipoxygenase